ncbi:hypothetical protein TEA_012739 [Camellia sinensis var. sinensis]|uniref:Pentatricopeptide repeat-containing protein n=1 Tax=Camellia sinensis var. sinensis TaxID=542762 RepID=A0A4S4D6S4_CAMSN|nr:hypothetical protein TEA_012739 [Camellia sinensis var. sinensis]
MHKNSILPNHYTFPFALKAFSDLRDLKQGQCIHTQIIKMSHFNDIYVQNSLLNVYLSGGNMDLCRKVFDEMPQRDAVSWTIMITGYQEAGKFDDALVAFEKMRYAGVVSNMANALSVCSSFGAIYMGIWIHGLIKRRG